MTEQDQPPPPRGQLDQEAATWCVRMHGEEAEQWRGVFAEWLRRGALHRRAYNRMEEIYLLGAKLRPAAQDVVPARSRAPLHRPALWGAGATVALGAVALAWIFSVGTDIIGAHDPEVAVVPDRALLAAAGASPARFKLADGSTLTLLDSGAASVAYTAVQRGVRLERGTGRFSVVRGSRPFAVEAGGGLITARGTAFEVRGDRLGRVHVALFEGRLDVTHPKIIGQADGTSARVTYMTAGQRLSFTAAQPHVGSAGDPDDRNAPRQPQTVGELVDLANARSPQAPRLVVEDASVRAIRLSGSFRVHDPEIVADRLSSMLLLTVDRSRPGMLFLRRAVP